MMDDSTSRKETGGQLTFYFSEMVFPLKKRRPGLVARPELTYTLLRLTIQTTKTGEGAQMAGTQS